MCVEVLSKKCVKTLTMKCLLVGLNKQYTRSVQGSRNFTETARQDTMNEILYMDLHAVYINDFQEQSQQLQYYNPQDFIYNYILSFLYSIEWVYIHSIVPYHEPMLTPIASL